MTRLAAASDGHGGLTRNRQVNPQNTALLIIDVQHYCVYPGQGEWEHIEPQNVPADLVYYFGRIESMVLPNIARLQKACRKAGSEVMYTVIESLTSDGRERGLDYKISGLLVPKGSPWVKIPENVKPLSDKIIIPKGSSSVFNLNRSAFSTQNAKLDSAELVAG